MDPIILYVIGAQKSGTTWLGAQFRRHPEIAIGVKEIHYWSAVRPPYARDIVARLQDGIARDGKEASRKHRHHLKVVTGDGQDHGAYVEFLHLRRRPETRVVCDITPLYALLSAETYAEMAALGDQTRFLYILRDPLDRLISEARSRPVEGAADDAARDAALARRFEERIDVLTRSQTQGDPAPRHRAEYHKTIAALESAVPADHILYAFYEDLVTAQRLGALEGWLGLTAPLWAQPGEVRNPATYRGWTPREDQIMRARRALAPVYEFMSARYGERLPNRWRASQAA
ncbi:MAG: sulfotransferase [Pseudomonadota bacterium]